MSAGRRLRCVMAQLNLVVGDVESNTSRVIAAARRARDEFGGDLIMVPELAVSGYPPEDLLFHKGLKAQVAGSIKRLRDEVRGITLVAGYPEYVDDRIYNSAIVIRDGDVLANHRKACLPNYRVFDEKRYFTPGTLPTVIDLNGIRAGILVCEDVWAAGACCAGAQRGCRGAVGHQCVAIRGQQATPARGGGGPQARGGDRRSSAVRQLDRRPGRTGVRRQFLRHERRRRGHAACAGVRRGTLSGGSRGARAGQGHAPCRAISCRFRARKRASTAPLSSVRAIMSINTDFRARCWGFPAASTRP